MNCRTLTAKRPERAACRGSRGFTLAELLVAVTLLTLVMTSVYSLAHSAIGSWRAAERGYDIHFEARNFMTLFTHEYNNIVGRAAHLFEGDRNEIVMFVIAQPFDLEQGEGPRLMRVSYAYNRNKRTIEREEALVEAALPVPNPEGLPVESDRIKLQRAYKKTVANNVNRFDLQYVWAPVPEEISPEEPPVPEPLVYFDRHQEQLGLPQALEVSLEIFDEEDRARVYPLKTLLPMRAPSYRKPRQLLEEL